MLEQGHHALFVGENVIERVAHHAAAGLAASGNGYDTFLTEALLCLLLWRKRALQDCVEDVVAFRPRYDGVFGLV